MNERFSPEIVDAEIVSPEAMEAEILPPRSPQCSRRSPVKLALIAVGVLAFVGLGIYVIVTGKQEDADKVADMVRHHPLVIEKLGGIEECTYKTFASLNEGGKRTDVFDVRGPKGSAQFVTFTFMYKFRSVKLRTAEGEWELLD